MHLYHQPATTVTRPRIEGWTVDIETALIVDFLDCIYLDCILYMMCILNRKQCLGYFVDTCVCVFVSACTVYCVLNIYDHMNFLLWDNKVYLFSVFLLMLPLLYRFGCGGASL